MLTLGEPWWQLVLRAASVYVGLLILIRLSGKRTVGELSVFDLIVVVLLGSAMRASMIGNDKSLQGGFIVVLTLLLLNYASALLSSRFRSIDRLIQGRPVLLARDGEVFEEVLRRLNVPLSDFDSAVRKAGCANNRDIAQAILEPNGTITILKDEAG